MMLRALILAVCMDAARAAGPVIRPEGVINAARIPPGPPPWIQPCITGLSL